MSGLLINVDNSFRERLWKNLIIAIPYFWLLLFFLAPFLIVLKISLADPIIAQPPFTPLFQDNDDGSMSIYTTFDNYLFLFQDSLYLVTYLSSVKLAFISTVLALFIGYPIAYGIARSPQPTRNILLLLVVIPFWISFLLRVYAWMGILKTKGLLNGFLLWIGIIDQPLELLYTDTAVYIGMIYSYLPFMILPLYVAIEQISPSLEEAALDLYANSWSVFWHVIMPVMWPGVVTTGLFSFLLAYNDFTVTVSLLSGENFTMVPKLNSFLGTVMYEGSRMNAVAAVVSATAPLFLLVMFFQRQLVAGLTQAAVKG